MGCRSAGDQKDKNCDLGRQWVGLGVKAGSGTDFVVFSSRKRTGNTVARALRYESVCLSYRKRASIYPLTRLNSSNVVELVIFVAALLRLDSPTRNEIISDR